MRMDSYRVRKHPTKKRAYVVVKLYGRDEQLGSYG